MQLARQRFNQNARPAQVFAVQRGVGDGDAINGAHLHKSAVDLAPKQVLPHPAVLAKLRVAAKVGGREPQRPSLVNAAAAVACMPALHSIRLLFWQLRQASKRCSPRTWATWQAAERAAQPHCPNQRRPAPATFRLC